MFLYRSVLDVIGGLIGETVMTPHCHMRGEKHPVAGSDDSEGGTEVSLQIDEGNGWFGWGGESPDPCCTWGHLVLV